MEAKEILLLGKLGGWQGAEDYPGVDKWGTIILEKKNNSLW